MEGFFSNDNDQAKEIPVRILDKNSGEITMGRLICIEYDTGARTTETNMEFLNHFKKIHVEIPKRA